MKKFLTLLFGNLGLLISAGIMSAASWFLLPIGVQILRGAHVLSNVIGWIFICPFAIGFFLSTVCSSIALMGKGIKSKKWLWLVLGALVLFFDIVILILSLI